jgi:hypothetical protein
MRGRLEGESAARKTRNAVVVEKRGNTRASEDAAALSFPTYRGRRLSVH